MMRRAALVCAVFLLLASTPSCTMWKEKPVKAWDSATGGEHLVRLFWDDVKAKNWSELEQHIAPTCVFVGPSATLDRAGALEHLRAMEITELSLGEFTVQPGGGDTVVVGYTATFNGKSGGHALPASTHMLSVWQKMNKSWMMIANSVTLAALPQ